MAFLYHGGGILFGAFGGPGTERFAISSLAVDKSEGFVKDKDVRSGVWDTAC
jgi:hypothetical protein